MIKEILEKQYFNKEDIKQLLLAEGEDMKLLLDKALAVKLEKLDNYVHLRGLIELSNICRKSCLYCGVRSGNNKVVRYTITDDEVLECAEMAYKLGYGSVAIQSGERNDRAFTGRITKLVREIKKIGDGALGITLSLGEQTPEVYREWFEAGAHRYLLRIESSNENLYYKIHPHDETHDFKKRLDCIDSLISIGYQTGTGVMIGLPFQTVDDLADDLFFFKNKNVAMVGMGPFIPHPDTPLAGEHGGTLELALRTMAVMRLLMPDINIPATTAMESLHPQGRIMALQAGANVVMPNVTEGEYRRLYELYPGKICINDTPAHCRSCIGLKIQSIGRTIGQGWGGHKTNRN